MHHHSITKWNVNANILSNVQQFISRLTETASAGPHNRLTVKLSNHTMPSCNNDLTLRSGELGGSLLVSDAY